MAMRKMLVSIQILHRDIMNSSIKLLTAVLREQKK